MTEPLDAVGRAIPAPAEARAARPYGLLAVVSGHEVQAVRERPDVLESAERQLRAFIDGYFGEGATPTEAEVRARVSAEIGRYVPAMAGTPSLGTLRAALAQQLGVHPEANLAEMLGAAERRWPARVQQAPPRNAVRPAFTPGITLDPPRPPASIPPRALSPRGPDPEALAAEAHARRQRDLADIVDLWRSLPGDRNLYPVQKDEHRAHALRELAGMYGSREAGLQAVAAIDPTLAAEMGRWVRPPLR